MATTYPKYPSGAGWHPIHGLLAAYPIACFTGAFLTDIAYAETYNMQWANFSIWLITAGLVMGVLAAVVGIVDFVASKRVRAHRPGWFHSVGNALVLLLSLWNAFVHSRDAYTSVVPMGIILSGIVTVLVLVTAWIGNSIVYRQQAGGVR
ncbi:DUF2231 domain-containing protein [Sphingomonas bacterium]|uniref:DUF2231 domain-containing protein n=1 Tax=Sphingomonas bacterium TaxID=1895847 RepID=UPI00157764D5|nr:DUF2231 domain-containing protein [Sphingomonas bacterium]